MKLARIVHNEKGVALITSLMLTFLSLVIIMTALYLMTLSIKQTGAMKNYKTALQASYGGSDLILKDVIPQLLMKADTLTTASPSTVTQVMQGITSNFPGLNDFTIGPNYSSQSVAAACINQKLTSAPPWNACSSPSPTLSAVSPRAKDLPDFKFTVPSAVGADSFTVYSKIVDTVPGNSDMSGVKLMGAGVAEVQNNVTPQHQPYVFRIEVQAERTTNATENANLSLLYAY